MGHSFPPQKRRRGNKNLVPENIRRETRPKERIVMPKRKAVCEENLDFRGCCGQKKLEGAADATAGVAIVLDSESVGSSD